MPNSSMPNQARLTISLPEFIALIALMTSLIALSIDAMLPALAQMGSDLNAPQLSDTQLVISLMFLGMAISQVFYGPLSDAFGRKPVIYFGFLIFIVGCAMSALAESFSMLLISRVLQGIGIASPRVLSMTIVRDLFQGREMARVMSFITSVFIVVPVLAPAMGQGVMLLAGWRAIFWVIAALAVLLLLWFGLRQKETLAVENRIPIAFGPQIAALKQVLNQPIVMGYTIMSGFIFGGFLSYLSSAQQIFQGIYDTGKWFPLLFAILAIAIGIASIYNGRQVVKQGMRFLTERSLRWIIIFAASFFLLSLIWSGKPPLALFLLYMLITFFHIGILFGNMTSLAMEPLNEYAGIGAGVVGSLSTLISVPVGILIGRYIDETLYALVIGFFVTAVISLLMMRRLPR